MLGNGAVAINFFLLNVFQNIYSLCCCCSTVEKKNVYNFLCFNLLPVYFIGGGGVD